MTSACDESAKLVITGMGAVGAFGGSAQELWSALLAGHSLARPSKRLAEAPMAAEVTDFDLMTFRRSAKASRSPRVSQFALAAAAQAINASGLSGKGIDKDEVAIVYGTGNGPSEIIERNLRSILKGGLGGVEPLGFQESVFNAPASMVSIEYGFRGPLIALPMGWGAGGFALTTAADLISFGHAPVALVIAADDHTRLTFDSLAALKLVGDTVRPFDRRSNGTVIGEGSAALVVERRDHAQKRGATVLAELAGWSSVGDIAPLGAKMGQPEGLHDGMRQAMGAAGVSSVDVVYAGSYCTKDADLAEARAIHTASGNARVTNIRGVIGEPKGPTGLLNVIAAIHSIKTGIVPPTVGFEEADPGCPPIAVSPETQRLERIDTVLCNSFWIHGTNNSCLLRSPQ